MTGQRDVQARRRLSSDRAAASVARSRKVHQLEEQFRRQIAEHG